MKFFRPASLSEALEIKATIPRVSPVAGGTDIMVLVNFDRLRPEALIDLSDISEIQNIEERSNKSLRIGAGVTFEKIIRNYAAELPGLVMAARTVGSPQIRNRATIGGNIATASPAGDSLPPLVASGATVELASVEGHRELILEEFLLGPKRSALKPNELVVAINVPRQSGPQLFSKVGTRNAMVISVSSIALELRPSTKEIRCAIGSSTPTVRRARSAEWLAAEITWPDEDGPPCPLSSELINEFGSAVEKESSPIDDVRGTSRYRRHALRVLACRNLKWAWDDLIRGKTCA